MPNCHDRIRARLQQHDLAAIAVAVDPAIEDLHVDARAVIGLHRYGHVLLVNEHAMIGIGQRRGGHVLGLQKERPFFGNNSTSD